MNLNDLTNILTISKAIPMHRFAKTLKESQYLDDAGKKALKSYKKYMRITVFVVFIVVLALFIATFSCLNTLQNYVKRTGTVENGQIKYVQNEMQYKSFEDLDLEEYNSAKDGEKFILYFDNVTDEYIKGVPKENLEQQENKAIGTLIITMLVSVITLSVWGIIGKETVGKDFSNYYAIMNKRKSDQLWNQEKKQLYEIAFITDENKKYTIKVNILFIFMSLLFIIGCGIAGVLIIGEVFSMLPNEDLVFTTRIIGVIIIIIEILIMYIMNKIFTTKISIVYSNPSELYDTQLLAKKENGEIGFTSVYGIWIRLIGITIINESNNVVKVKCKYQNAKTGLVFKYTNYIVKNDPIFNDIMELNDQTPVKNKKYISTIYVAIVILLILSAISYYLITIRDKSIINFNSMHQNIHIKNNLNH